MVRLKELVVYITALHGYLFQFRHGTIKRKITLYLRESEAGFNSVMVRLKEKNRSVIHLMKMRFNSVMVRLKVRAAGDTNTVFDCFNSVMVRLKGPAFKN